MPVWLFVVVGLVALLCVGGVVAAVTSTVVLIARNDGGPNYHRPASRAAIGQPARDGKFEFTVHKVLCGQSAVGQGFYQKEATGQFCVAEVTVKNVGNSPQPFSDTEQQAFSPDGKEFHADPDAAEYLNEMPTYDVDINPGNQIDTAVVFDIPDSASISKLRLHDQLFSRGAEITVK